jgi:hypothetical protein
LFQVVFATNLAPRSGAIAGAATGAGVRGAAGGGGVAGGDGGGGGGAGGVSVSVPAAGGGPRMFVTPGFRHAYRLTVWQSGGKIVAGKRLPHPNRTEGTRRRMRAPTATELLNDPTAQQALDQAWVDSLSTDPVQRHEEGGWIYMDTGTGQITVRRAVSGGQAMINLTHPPMIAGSVVVGKFHTHPNPTAEGWNPGPSEADRRIDALHGVPDLIRADDGIYVSGPVSRRGGLGGNAGYPS